MKCVSIIIPIYNLEKYLVECLDSVIDQTYTNLEIILVDDGSEDKSLEICQIFKEKDKRIKILSHKNSGVSYTRNRGIRVATGDYIMFVDGDDYLETSWVEQYINTAETEQADIVIGGLTFLMESGERTPKFPPVIGQSTNNIWDYICTIENEIFGYVSNKLYRKDLLLSNKILFDEMMYAQEDFDFALSAYYVGEHFAFIDECGYTYRYISGKRSHPLLQYMKNQLKLLKLAKEKTSLQFEQEKVIFQKILDDMFSYIYFLPINKTFIKECRKLELLEGLKACLERYSGKGEQAFVSRLVLKKSYFLLKIYFGTRHTLRRLIKRKRKRIFIEE